MRCGMFRGDREREDEKGGREGRPRAEGEGREGKL